MDLDAIINNWIDVSLSKQIDSRDTRDSHDHFNITYELYMNILNIVQQRELSVENTMPKVLRLINPQVKLPTLICNLTRKVKRFKGNGKTTIQTILPCTQTYIGEWTQAANLKISDLLDSNSNKSIKQEHITNGLIYELEQYRHKENLPVGTVLHWTEQFFPRIDGQSANVQAHSKAWKSVYERIMTQKHKVTKSKDHINVHKEHVVGFMQQSFIIPQTWLTQREQLTQSMQNAPLNKILSSHNPLLAMAEYQGEVFGKYVKNTESKM